MYLFIYRELKVEICLTQIGKLTKLSGSPSGLLERYLAAYSRDKDHEEWGCCKTTVVCTSVIMGDCRIPWLTVQPCHDSRAVKPRT